MNRTMHIVLGGLLAAGASASIGAGCGSSTGTGNGGSASTSTTTTSTGTTSSTATTTTTTSTATTSSSTTSSSGGNTQVPPQGAAALLTWLQAASSPYKSWHCEAAEHKSNPISPHTNAVRVCTNDALHGATKGSASPVDSAAVKEIWSDFPNDPDAGADSSAPAIVGYAVTIKTAADTAAVDGGPNGDGSNWYFFEQILGKAPYADGKGPAGCVPCHSAANSDTTTHAGHGDFTYLDP